MIFLILVTGRRINWSNGMNRFLLLDLSYDTAFQKGSFNLKYCNINRKSPNDFSKYLKILLLAINHYVLWISQMIG